MRSRYLRGCRNYRIAKSVPVQNIIYEYLWRLLNLFIYFIAVTRWVNIYKCIMYVSAGHASYVARSWIKKKAQRDVACCTRVNMIALYRSVLAVHVLSKYNLGLSWFCWQNACALCRFWIWFRVKGLYGFFFESFAFSLSFVLPL